MIDRERVVDVTSDTIRATSDKSCWNSCCDAEQGLLIPVEFWRDKRLWVGICQWYRGFEEQICSCLLSCSDVSEFARRPNELRLIATEGPIRGRVFFRSAQISSKLRFNFQ
jgi:hypothetical protein